VSAIAPDTILALFLILCRVGACITIAPGFSSQHIPVRVRLYVALAASMALAPMLIDGVRARVADDGAPTLVLLIATEIGTGLLIGFVARLFFVALQMITVAMTQAIGLSAMPGAAPEDGAQVPALSTLYSTTATTLMFVAGLHTELLRGLAESYGTLPPGASFPAQAALVDIADQTAATFLVALRIGSPFIVYSIVVNFAIGITNKLTPQIPVYFIATPFVLVGGLMLLAVTISDFFGYFQQAFSTWLARG
jgi:flagellar biosynthetic protein FliR